MRVIVSVMFVCLSGCLQQQVGMLDMVRTENWIDEPTPSNWLLGEKWQITVRDTEGNIVKTFVARFSSESADTCTSGEWKVVEILDEIPAPQPEFQGIAAYTLQGQLLGIDLTSSLCSNASELVGRLTELGWTGEYKTSHTFGGELIGNFVAVRTDRGGI